MHFAHRCIFRRPSFVLVVALWSLLVHSSVAIAAPTGTSNEEPPLLADTKSYRFDSTNDKTLLEFSQGVSAPVSILLVAPSDRKVIFAAVHPPPKCLEEEGSYSALLFTYGNVDESCEMKLRWTNEAFSITTSGTETSLNYTDIHSERSDVRVVLKQEKGESRIQRVSDELSKKLGGGKQCDMQFPLLGNEYLLNFTLHSFEGSCDVFALEFELPYRVYTQPEISTEAHGVESTTTIGSESEGERRKHISVAGMTSGCKGWMWGAITEIVLFGALIIAIIVYFGCLMRKTETGDEEKPVVVKYTVEEAKEGEIESEPVPKIEQPPLSDEVIKGLVSVEKVGEMKEPHEFSAKKTKLAPRPKSKDNADDNPDVVVSVESDKEKKDELPPHRIDPTPYLERLKNFQPCPAPLPQNKK